VAGPPPPENPQTRWLAAAGESTDDAVRSHPADAPVLGVGDVEASVGAEGDVARLVQLGCGGRAAVARVPIRPDPGDRTDKPIPVHAADAVFVLVGDVEAAVWAESEPARSQPGLRRGLAVTGETEASGPGDRRDHAVRRHDADAMSLRVRDEEAAVEAITLRPARQRALASKRLMLRRLELTAGRGPRAQAVAHSREPAEGNPILSLQQNAQRSSSNAGRHCVATVRAVAEGRRDAEVATAASPGGG
jgi:hypothetical protein